MKLLTYYHADTLKLGIKTDNGILDVAAAAQDSDIPTTMEALLNTGGNALADLSELAAQADSSTLLNEVDLQLGPCVTNPEKIICIGLNYRQHALEAGADIPKHPVLFSKFNNTLAAANESIPLPANAIKYDYEVELGVVIGKTARYVKQAEALDYVFGYCSINDLSVRDLQFRTSQWLLGKTLDKFLPHGPYLVTADEVADPQNLSLRCWLNGDLRQNSNTNDMIFSVAECISYISQYMTLKPGDIISTGTPEGVILGMTEKNWLKPGDEVTVEVEGLGKLTNMMRAEA